MLQALCEGMGAGHEVDSNRHPSALEDLFYRFDFNKSMNSFIEQRS